MTREQLDAIRARYGDEPLLGEMRTDRFGNLITVTREHPVVALLAEVERLTADPLPAAAWVREVERAAFNRGAESMRAAAVAVASKRANLQRFTDSDCAWGRSAECIRDELRHLLVPEDKS